MVPEEGVGSPGNGGTDGCELVTGLGTVSKSSKSNKCSQPLRISTPTTSSWFLGTGSHYILQSGLKCITLRLISAQLSSSGIHSCFFSPFSSFTLLLRTVSYRTRLALNSQPFHLSLRRLRLQGWTEHHFLSSSRYSSHSEMVSAVSGVISDSSKQLSELGISQSKQRELISPHLNFIMRAVLES